MLSMRELYGTVFARGRFSGDALKRHALLMDKFYVIDLGGYLSDHNDDAERATFEFLHKQGIVRQMPAFTGPQRVMNLVLDSSEESIDLYHDIFVRDAALVLKAGDGDAIPLCASALPCHMDCEVAERLKTLETVVRVTLEAMPIPDGLCAWEDILDFRWEASEKQWSLRRLLQTLASTKMSESEIRDALDFSTNEYTKAMKRRKMAITHGTVTAFAIPASDMIVNPSGNHIASALGAAVLLNKLRVELMEAELKAPGKECAYVFEARKRFGER